MIVVKVLSLDERSFLDQAVRVVGDSSVPDSPDDTLVEFPTEPVRVDADPALLLALDELDDFSFEVCESHDARGCCCDLMG